MGRSIISRISCLACIALGCVTLGSDRAAAQAQTQPQIEVHGVMSVVSQTSQDLRLVNANFSGESDFDHLRGRLFLNGGTERTHPLVIFIP